MKVIMLKDVKGVGKVNQILEVKDNFFRDNIYEGPIRR